MNETSRAILYLIYEGRTFDEVFQLHPNLTVLDIARAAGEGLRALEAEDLVFERARNVVASWEGGDLAQAVRRLHSALQEAST